MSNSNDKLNRSRLNILALDGGGVRGLSSLLILQALMGHVNDAIQRQKLDDENYEELGPRDVFDLVVGTSTGGLIAIMLGKLGMTLADSIKAYHGLSKRIFGKKHFRGRLTHGLAITKYSGRRMEHEIQELIRNRGFEVNIPIESVDNSDAIACAVLCREHEEQSKYSSFKTKPVQICSLRCPQPTTCLVSEAARATSAAPTFFPVQHIGSRLLVDGGMEYNNPSFVTYDHYTEQDKVSRNPAAEIALPIASHGHLDFSTVRFVNLGTGTKPVNQSEILPERQRYRFVQLVPGAIRMLLFMKETLVEFAVSSERVAKDMGTLAGMSRNSISYERFSADNGVCYIKMDKYKELNLIEILTSRYVQLPEIRARLRRVGEEIAEGYLRKQHRNAPSQPATPVTLTTPSPITTSTQALPSQSPTSLQALPSQVPITLAPSTNASAGTDSRSECSEGNTQMGPDQDRDLNASSASSVSSEMAETNIAKGLSTRVESVARTRAQTC